MHLRRSHPKLFWRVGVLSELARPARGYQVVGHSLAALRHRHDVVSTRIRNTAHRRRKSGMITEPKLSGLLGQAP